MLRQRPGGGVAALSSSLLLRIAATCGFLLFWLGGSMNVPPAELHTDG